jgi:DnaJ-class molecular chaperone
VSEDYYEILGVDEDATGDEIRSAYRRRAKECHPDCVEGGSEPFRRVHQAYEVLSDPARRRVYDRGQDDGPTVSVRRGAHASSTRSGRSPVEPLVPRRATYARRSGFLDDFFASPFDRVLNDLWGGFGSGFSPPPVPRELEMDLHLSPLQASSGGTFRVEVSRPGLCPTCYGEGWTGPYRCPRCEGTGVSAVGRPLSVSYPPGIADGDTGRMSLDSVGLPESDLVVHFHVHPR